MRRNFALLLACLITISALAGCTPTAKTPAVSGILNMYTSTEITNINPHVNMDIAGGDIINPTSLRLYCYSPNATGDGFVLGGELADQDPVPMDDSGTVWQIKIKENAYWQNGDHITADDVVYNYQMLIDPLLLNSRGATAASDRLIVKNATKYYLQASEGTAIDYKEVGFQKVDDYTIELVTDGLVTVTDIKGHFANKASCLVHKGTYEGCMSADRTTNTYGTSLDKYMSAGMFILKNWVPGVQFDLERNDKYLNADAVHLQGMTYRTINDSNTALELFLNGELDSVALSADAKEQYADDPRVWSAPSNTVSCMLINCGNTDHNKVLQNVNFRKALFHAVDRKSIAKLVKGVPANWILGLKCLGNPETGERYRELEGAQAYLTENHGYDPELAKKYYETAMSEAGLEELTLSIMYSETSNNNKATAEYLQQSLPQVLGDTFSIELSSASSSVVKATRKAWAKGDNPNTYELGFTGWSTSALHPWNALKVYCGWYASKNEPFFNAEYDELWELANQSERAKKDIDYRLSLTFQMEKMLLDQVVTLPMYEIPSYRLINERVKLAVNSYIEGLGFAWPYASIVEE